MSATKTWLNEAVGTLARARGVPVSGALGWTIIRGHRAQVLIPSDSCGALGVLRKWQSAAVAEHDLSMLRALEEQEPAAVLATLPRHLGSFGRGDVVLTAQTWLPGAPLAVSHAIPARAILGTVADWFQARLAGRATTSAFPNLLSNELLGRLTRRTPDGQATRALSAFVEALRGQPARCGILHNDLHPGNLLFDTQARLSGVLDWEHAGPGPLLCDWFGFVNELALMEVGGLEHARSTEDALQAAWQARSEFCVAALRETARLTQPETPVTTQACFRLAAFRFCYARTRDEGPAAQAAITRCLGLALPAL